MQLTSVINQHLFNDNRLGEAKVSSTSTDDLYIVSSTCILYRERCADSELEAGLLHMPPTEKHKSSNFTSKHSKLKTTTERENSVQPSGTLYRCKN